MPRCRTKYYFSFEDSIAAREDHDKPPHLEFPDRAPTHGKELVGFLNSLRNEDFSNIKTLEQLRQRMQVRHVICHCDTENLGPNTH